MTRPIRDVVVVGAGAMGCLFAARMARAGATVTLVDVDAAKLDRLTSDGLLLIDDMGRHTVRLRACPAGEVAGPVDLLLLFTKGNHSAAAVRSVAHLAASRPVALTLQNGLGNAEILAEAFGADHVLMGTAHVPADLEGPNAVRTHGFAHVLLGGRESSAHRHAEGVATLLDAAGFAPVVSDDIEAAIWEKLAFNAALNALAMVTASTNGDMNNAPGLRIAHDIARETARIANGKGIAVDAATVVQSIDRAVAEHGSHKASMLQDREAGRPTEIEHINGAIVREGAALGIDAPVTSTLAELVRLTELRASRTGPEGGQA